MSKLAFKDLFEKYPYAGIIKGWESHRDFGWISLSDSLPLLFAHIFNRNGPQVRKLRLQGKRCLLAIGFEPRTIPESAISWIIEDEVEGDIAEYMEAREATIAEWKAHQLASALRAQWYLESVWRGQTPSHPLRQDQVLLAAIDPILTSPTDPLDYIELLRAKIDSPFYGFSEREKQEVWKTGLVRLANDFAFLFQGYAAAQLSAFLEKVGPESATIFAPIVRSTFINQAVALDIESDGENLFQLGFALHDQSRLIEVGRESGVSPIGACQILTEHVGKNWIVGHNAIQWDIPILRRLTNKAEFLPNPVWDTLLVSLLLVPWKPTHSLTTSVVAHRADSDAAAAFQLFRDQVEHLPLNYASLLDSSFPNTPAALIRECAEVLSRSTDRNYPKAPSFLTAISGSEDGGVLAVLPEMLLPWCGWVPGIRFVWPEGYSKLEHFTLPAKKVADEIASSGSENPLHILLLQILSDAEANNVHVLVRMLPYWLRAKCRELINKCATVSPDGRGTINWRVCTYESCRSQTPSAQGLYNEAVKIVPEMGALSLLEKLAHLSTSGITSLLPRGAEVEMSYQLFPLSREKVHSLLGASIHNDGNYWLEYHPIRKRTARPWQLWLSRQVIVRESSETGMHSTGIFAHDLFVRPRWIDDNTGTTVSTDSLWPTSANRVAYWRDLIGQFLSLRAAYDHHTVLVLMLEHDEEREIARRLFSDLGISVDGDTIAQQLQALNKRNIPSGAVDLLENVSKWQEMAADLNCPIHFVVAAIPLSQWLMCSQKPMPEGVPQAETIAVFEDTADEKEDESISEDAAFEMHESVRPHFTNEAIESCFSIFLGPWVRASFGNDEPTILDPRLNLSTAHLKRLGKVEDFVLRPLSDLQMTLLDRYKDEFGQLERREPPSEYEAYEKFLDDHWRNHDDKTEMPWKFKDDTQKPAIEAICQNRGDLLVRLPTGEGKSVIFQVPALLRGFCTQRLTIVISPLRALMRDQVASLWKMGFFSSVDYLSADREPWETSEVYQGILDNRIKLLYIAPERFRVARFRDALDRRCRNDDGLEFVVIDETHLVSQWGFEFRPDYLFAMEEINRLYRTGPYPVRVLMFSATVTRAVEGDLRKLLSYQQPESLLVRPDGYWHPIQNFIHLKPEEVPVALYGEGRSAKIIARTGEIQHIIREANPDSQKSIVMVFVTRRDHAEALDKLLRKDLPEQFRVEFFHAGLPPSERLRVYESVKRCAEDGANVLVATKAFGMGMDISNIHWCIHLAPPAYLEDYLQEVGRTGRGTKERASAGLDHIECTLLHHPEDFGRNHELVRRNMIQPPDLLLLWDEVLRRSAVTSTGKLISILPTDGYQEMKGNRLRQGLSWLERVPAKRLSILGFLPDMLRIRINQKVLQECGKVDDSKGAVAKSILRLYESPGKPSIRSAHIETQSGLWEFLKKFVGFLFTSPETKQTIEPSALATGGPLESEAAEIHLGAILSAAKLPCADELYRALLGLQQAGGIAIERHLIFKKGSTVDKSKMVWTWVDALRGNLVGRPWERGREVPPEEMMEFVNENISQDGPVDQKMRSNAESVVRAVIRLINASGLRIREQLNEARQLVYHYTLPELQVRVLNRRIKSNVKMAKSLEELLRGLGDGRHVNLAEILSLLGPNGRMRDLRIALKLLSDLGLYSSEQSLLCYSYLMEIHTTDRLLDKTDADIKMEDLQMYEELAKVNRFAELRSFAMAMFARLNSDEDRRQFIDEYFQAGSPKDLEDLLGRAVGGVDDPDVPEALKIILNQVRQAAIAKALDRFRLGEEPEQYAVCCRPWNRNLLVNAGPGAGKTEVLIMRAAHLINQQGLRPEQVLILAFNRAVVHEIRVRIKRLFDQLGYGAYVRRLKVRTFTAFALEHLPVDLNQVRYADGDLDTLVEEFSRQCEDLDFARSVIAGVRAILVDEFQDMNETRYELLKALVKAASNAGIMVIGDDDQDILRWNRKENGVEAREYFARFRQDFAPVDVLNLKVNFRSAEAIVQRAQSFLSGVLANVSERIKTDIALSARGEALPGSIDDRSATDPEALRRLLKECPGNDRTTAVLCRSNYQACQVYEELREHISGIQIQGRENLKLNRLRHIGAWVDMCRKVSEEDGDQQLDGHLFDKISQYYQTSGIPELKTGNCEENKFLWDSVLEENPRATLAYFIAFVDELRSDDFVRLWGKTQIRDWVEKQEQNSLGKILVSTVHKVKGLEFDAVVILPSKAEFPFADNDKKESLDLRLCQADEARLYYVAMTRSKSHLAFKWEAREKAWKEGKRYKGLQSGTYLTGDPEEVFTSWPGFKDTIQEYIKSQVCCGDFIRLSRTSNSIALVHRNRRVGFLSRAIVDRIGNANLEKARLRVHTVYRYPVNEEKYDEIRAQLTDHCRAKGWSYTILVTGHISL